ncbi:MAG: hypothetical protein WAX04_06260 [Oscillospiraceae bacterium]
MSVFDWDNISSKWFSITNIENRVNADKLFVSLLIEIKNKGIEIKKDFIISEIANLIPRGTAGVSNYSTYGFSFMSMLSGQKSRDYFIFQNHDLRSLFTDICNNNHDRDNYYWRKHYSGEKLRINPKYYIQ